MVSADSHGTRGSFGEEMVDVAPSALDGEAAVDAPAPDAVLRIELLELRRRRFSFRLDRELHDADPAR
jgi:hypothetical protein